MVKMFYDSDCNLSCSTARPLPSSALAPRVMPMPMNLHDSGVNVVVGLRPAQALRKPPALPVAPVMMEWRKRLLPAISS